MRKNSPRKWLHAILDLLPVILIPVFMIYSHRHNINDNQIIIGEDVNLPVNVVGTYGNSLVNTTKWSGEYDGDIITFSVIHYENSYYFGDWYDTTGQELVLYYGPYSVTQNHTYFFKYSNFHNTYSNSIVYSHINNIVTQSTFFNYRPTTSSARNIQPRVYVPSGNYGTISFDFIVIDLTLTYGSGNEPSANDFNSFFEERELFTKISQNGINNILIQEQTIYNDTDIGSQFFYCLYNSVDKYFNMGNVFNLTGVYDWFVVNIFGGNAPLSLYVVWNIVLYEFVMDLLFLLYGLFMFFIDTCSNLMDRFNGNLSGRR